jgi:tetratricopeptide (TPR) repeat protein
LGINPDANIVTDLQQLHQGWTAAQKLIDRATSDHSKSRAVLEAAASQYHGDFLHDFALNDAPDFDVWVSTQRELWRQRTELVLDQLSLLQTDSGAYAEALATVQRWLELDPLREEAHRRVIRLHLAMGDRSAALRAYDACRAILAKELQAEPSPETVALAEQIRNAVLPQWSARTPARLQEADPERPLSSLDDAPLVGRAAEFARIIVAYHAARRGQSQVVVIEGEPGLGKTRLATEALSWTAAQGADVLQGRAFEAGGRLPYGPLVEALRPRVERERAPDDLLPDVWLIELSRLLPELRDRYPDLPLPTGDDATVKIRLFEAIVRLIVALAEHAPVVLFVDDIQWADSATLDVLLYAVRRWSELGASVLLVVTMRPEATAPESGLTAWLKGIAGDATLTRLRLEPLAQTDALQFVQALAAIDEGAGVPSDTVQQFSTWLFTETGGQPLFVIETMKMVLERGPSAAHRRADGSWAIDMAAALRETSMLRATVAPGVRDVIQARLAQASPATRTLLNAAAVLGSAFTFAQLCMVSGVDEDSALEALEEALAKRLVRQLEPAHSPNRAERYTFSHDNIRTVVYGQLSTIRQQILHRRAYELLAASAAPAAQLAHHALAARLSEPALHASIAAGNAAMAVFAVRDALPHYQPRGHCMVNERHR